MKIILNPAFQQFEPFVKSIPERFDKEGKTIYKQRNEIKVFDVDETLINVKRFGVPPCWNRVAYTFFREPKAERAFYYAIRLHAIGIETPRPIAFILSKRNGLLYDSYFISLQSDDYIRNMYEFGSGGVAGREDILRAFARFTAHLHTNGIYHPDYSPGNILFEETDGVWNFCLVDINRIHFNDDPVPVRKGCANFARLWGQEPIFRLLAETYAEARSANADECTRLILEARNAFWQKYRRKRDIPFEY